MNDATRRSVVVLGEQGRMSTMLCAALSGAQGIASVETLSIRRVKRPDAFLANKVRGVAQPPVIVDFCHPEATLWAATYAAPLGCPIVSGTSGLGQAELTALGGASKRVSVVRAANFSVGVLMLTRVVASLAKTLDGLWDAQVLDLHFASKHDTPSATALALASAWSSQRPHSSPTPPAALRIGDGVSEHAVYVAGKGERLEFVHKMLDRKAFVPSILKSIEFCASAAAGMYDLESVLFRDADEAHVAARTPSEECR